MFFLTGTFCLKCVPGSSISFKILDFPDFHRFPMQKFSTSAESIFIKIENRFRMVLKRSFLQYYEKIRRLGYPQAVTPQAEFPKIAKWPLDLSRYGGSVTHNVPVKKHSYMHSYYIILCTWSLRTERSCCCRLRWFQ